MESGNTNAALGVLKLLRRSADKSGRADVDIEELGREVGLSRDELQECLNDLQYEGFVTVQLSCQLKEDWR